MEASPLRKLLYPIEYGIVRGLLTAMQAMPLPDALATAERVGDAMCALDRRHRRVAEANLRMVYPTWSENDISGLVRECFRNMARGCLEFAYMPRLVTPTRWQEFIDFPDHHRVLELVKRGPAILVTGHIGNWEALGIVLGFLGIETYSLARRLDNPLLNDYCEHLRQYRKQRIVYKHGAVRAMSELLRQGHKLGFLIDQNAGRRGLFCDFMGIPASTTSIPALLAQRLGVPIVPGFGIRVGKGFRFQIITGDPILPATYADLPLGQAVAAMTAEATRQLEAVVRAHPAQWLWMHRRWKSRPPVERSAAEEYPSVHEVPRLPTPGSDTGFRPDREQPRRVLERSTASRSGHA